MLDLAKLMQCCLATVFLLPIGVSANSCFPVPDSKQTQYLIVYGDLMYEEARLDRLGQSVLELPVLVDDYKRAWQVRAQPDSLKFTRLGVVPSKEDSFNGVVVAVTTDKLTSIDHSSALECRVKIDREKLQSMSAVPVPAEGEFWIFEAKKKNVRGPTANYPIMQSKVDIFLTGCIDLTKHFKLKKFADLCVTTTKNWSPNWSNDRRQPIQVKAVQPKNKQVDELLEKLEGGLYERVKAD